MGSLGSTTPVIDPATGAAVEERRLALGSAADADAAVAAAHKAFEAWSATGKEERLDLLKRVASLYEKRAPEMAAAISQEMGAPISLARSAQVGAGLGHLKTFIAVLEEFHFDDRTSLGAKEVLLHEPLGVCACITPWNWPVSGGGGILHTRSSTPDPLAGGGGTAAGRLQPAC